MKMNKKDIIRNFIISNTHLPKQGSIEWKEARKNFIGGSEVSVVLNRNKNKTIRKLILEKIGLHSFTGNSATYWGNIFEPLIRTFTNRYFNCSILETGSIPYKNTNLSYSPDGIAYVDRRHLQDIIDTNRLEYDHEHIVLFEFKCPHSRIPDGEVPDYYITQPLTGMNIIDICEVSIFIEAIYRRCAFYDLQYNTKHVAYGHYNRTKLTNPPIEYGFMVIYTDTMNPEIESLLNTISTSGTKKAKHVYDLGTLYDKDIFDLVLEKCVRGELQIDYAFHKQYNPTVFNSYTYIIEQYNKASYYQATKELEYQKQMRPYIIGILPYKLMDIYINPIYKNHTFIEETNLAEKAERIIQFIDSHKHLDEKEITKKLKKYEL